MLLASIVRNISTRSPVSLLSATDDKTRKTGVRIDSNGWDGGYEAESCQGIFNLPLTQTIATVGATQLGEKSGQADPMYGQGAPRPQTRCTGGQVAGAVETLRGKVNSW